MIKVGAYAVTHAALSLPLPCERRATRERVPGLTQAHVAAELDTTQATVSRWEAGINDPRGQMLVAYVALLDRLRALTARTEQDGTDVSADLADLVARLDGLAAEPEPAGVPRA